MEEKAKLTQGQIKTRLRLKELFENEHFEKELSETLAINNHKKRNKQLWKFAEKYLLEYDVCSPFFDVVMGKDPKLDEQIGHELDVCELYDEADQYLNPSFPADFDLPPSRDPRKRAQINAFPIHLGISVYATKRDVLDYVTKRWDEIRGMLDEYYEKPKIPRRKRKQERDEMVWENRDLPADKIADLVNEKYPDETLTYADVHKILHYLRQRKRSYLV